MASNLDDVYDEVLAGVSVVSEARTSRVFAHNTAESGLVNLVIGIVKIKPNGINAADLRTLLSKDLPAIPTNYYFLTKQGWPVREEQESEIRVSELLDDNFLITIRRRFAHPRIGVRNSSHEVIGFIFIDYNKSIPELRQALKEQLTFLSPDLLLLDGRGWPVHPSQEEDLVTWDLISDGYITMRSSFAENVTNISHSSLDTPDNFSKKRKSQDLNWVSHHSIEEKPVTHPENVEYPKIFISYVRAEATKHAKDLKWELTDRGYIVFLDKDDIHGGTDWQDTLNNAVRGCTIFIPLITPQYGETVWTNREVKMADKLQKIIIPINFTSVWPPPCLEIQFTSLHFLPWKTNSEMEQEMLELPESRATDIRFWDTVYIKRVVDSIMEHYKEHLKEHSDFDQNEEEEVCILRSSKSIVTSPASPLADVEFDRGIELKTLVVLSAHPNDEDYVNTLRMLLGSLNYEVWSSSDIADESEIFSSQVTHLTSSQASHAPSFPDSCPAQPANNSQDSSCSDSFHYSGTKRRPSLKHSYSLIDSKTPSLFRSDSVCTLSPVSNEKLCKFRGKVQKAGAVIVLLSEDYCKAKTSKKQVYYCENRKPIIPIMINNFRPPCYITNFFGNDILEYSDMPEFFQDLQLRVKTAVNASSLEQPKICKNEIHLQSEVLKLKELIKNENCIYVMGSTRFCNARTDNICIAIGEQLAACKFLSVATNGFYGVGEKVGRSFCEEQDLYGQKPAHLFSILPKKDNMDFSKVSRQYHDGHFQKVPYGQTIFIGDSVCERDIIAARSFNVCLLIEGDSECAEEAERFVWNDNIVIPVISTGGAAAGEYSSRTWDVPPGVSENDWKLLSKKDEPVEVIAAAVKRILCSLKSKHAAPTDSGKPTRLKPTKKFPANVHN